MPAKGCFGANLAMDDERPLMAGSSPSTLTFQCRVKTWEQPLGACSYTPGPDPLLTSGVAGSGRRNPWKIL